MKFLRRKQKLPKFTGNCEVRIYTGDGDFVGRCYYSTYDGVCHLHGNVLAYLNGQRWPRDFELEKYDGSLWAERLRKEIKDA